MIILEKEDKNKINLINKIKEIIAKFINNNDNIEYLIDALYDLKFSNLDIFYEIILFSIENLYKLGNKFLEEKKNYSRYYSKTLYNKAEKMKSYINEEPGIKMNKELVLKYDEIEKNYSTKKEEIDSFAFIIEDKIKQNNIINYYNTGFELIDNIISQDMTNIDEENIKLIVDIYQEMVDSLSKGPISVLEVFCLIKIIEINFKIFKNNKFQLYDTLNERINYILKNLEENYDIKDEWFKHLIEINEEIKNKKKELI